ncbi:MULTISPECIES: glycosyltransferase family 4 protein [Romboutsia]|jgi:glycosyltransferase involved in cell wall biosynthesis|uniref:glycosyltransferase family 4 protein n=1 Tax=Romboutsia TaxID=1501226 RepID=UPI002173C509|nr:MULTISPECIES: glycosyltransferase family 4 protein [Romboutsia]MCI9061378.1 glycosyltransferase family 4 protein [Romboutsia sp.]
MKVLVVTHTTDLSGANKSLLGIIEQLSDRVEFVVVANNRDGELIEKLKSLNIKIIYKKYSWLYAKPRINTFKKIIRFNIDFIKYYMFRHISKNTLRELSKEQFDLIYTNTSTVDFGAIIADKLNVPHIWHIREFGEEDFGFKCIVSKKYRKKILKDAKFVILISNALKEKYINYMDSDKDNLRVVYNGLNVKDLYSPIKDHKFEDEINILIAGQVCEAKGQNQAIDAVWKLREKGFNINLYIAGSVYEEYINRSLNKYSDTNWIKILGLVKDMKELRNNIDIELVCSRNEAFGRVTLEAMLHGIPVVGSNVGGTLELIKNRETGMIYQYGDINDLANKIEVLIKEHELYNLIINNAMEFANKFTIEKTANGVLEKFNEIRLNSSSTSR